MCNNPNDPRDPATTQPDAYFVPLPTIDALRAGARAALAGALGADAPDGASADSLAFTADGNLFLTSAQPNGAAAIGTGQEGQAMALVMTVPTTPADLEGDGPTRVTVSLSMTAPQQGGVDIVFDVNANGAAVVEAKPHGDVTGLSLSTVWCIAKAGGSSILPAIVSALPSLVMGPEAFLAAIVAKLPQAMVGTATKVASGCF
jgi:hypothetical protein